MPAPAYLQPVIKTLTDTAFSECKGDEDAIYALMASLRLPNAEQAARELAVPLIAIVEQVSRGHHVVASE